MGTIKASLADRILINLRYYFCNKHRKYCRELTSAITHFLSREECHWCTTTDALDFHIYVPDLLMLVPRLNRHVTGIKNLYK